jgi:branched-chain amino acid transport system ATP-binding protein
MALLEAENVTVHYGKSIAVEDVSLRVEEGDVVSIIGANGAGKSTLLRSIMGLKSLTAGEVFFAGEKINGKATNEIVKRGLILVPEGRRLFPYLSVLNNLRLGASLIDDKDEIERTLEYVYRLFPRLKERKSQKAGTLSGGEQQMVAIGRALMGKPRLLCMDEPSLGLAPIVVETVGRAIKDVNQKGVTVLLVEQNVHLALEVASSCYALRVGRVVLSGDIATVRSSEVVKQAYLGG